MIQQLEAIKKSLRHLTEYIKNASIEQKCLLLLTLSIPFDRVPSYQFVSFDIRMSSVFALLCIGLATKKVVKDKKILYRLRPLTWALLWVGWLVVSVLWVHDYSGALKAVVPLVFLLVTSAAVAILWRSRYMKPIFITLIIGMALSVGFGVFQFIANFLGVSNAVTLIRPEYSWQGFGFPRIHSFSLEPLYFACYLLLPLSFSISYSIQRKLKVNPILVASIVVSSSVLVLTLSRGGIIGLLVVMATLLLCYKGVLRQLVTKQLLLRGLVGLLISLSLVVGLVSLFNKPGNDSDLTYNKRGIGTFITHLTNTRFFANKDNKNRDDSIGQRDTARSQSIVLISTTPGALIPGLGAGQYPYYAEQRFGTEYIGEVNNLILEQLVQGGLVGLGLLSIFVVTMLRKLYKYEGEFRWVSYALMAYLVAVILQAQTFHGLSLTHLWFALGIASALVVRMKSRKAVVGTSTDTDL